MGAAKASLVLGIISCACYLIGIGALTYGLVSIVPAIIGLCRADRAKKDGCECGTRTAGFVLSLIGLIFGILCFIGMIGLTSLFL